jgi:hypothetical protein
MMRQASGGYQAIPLSRQIAQRADRWLPEQRPGHKRLGPKRPLKAGVQGGRHGLGGPAGRRCFAWPASRADAREQYDHASKQLAMPVATTRRRPRQHSSMSTCNDPARFPI